MPKGQKNRYGYATPMSMQQAWKSGTRPDENIIVTQIPNRCSCTWSAHGRAFPDIIYVLKFRHILCFEFMTRGHD